MTDQAPAKRRLTPSVIVAIIGMAAATVLGGVTIWQTSADSQKQKIEIRLDKLTDAVHSLDITVSRIGQRLEDHISK